VIAKRKGVVARRSEGSVEQRREPMDKIADRRHTVPDERAMIAKSISIKGAVVDPTVARGRRLNLPREVCRMSRNRD